MPTEGLGGGGAADQAPVGGAMEKEMVVVGVSQGVDQG